MDESTQAKNDLESRLIAEAKIAPLTLDKALEIASMTLNGAQFSAFKTWFETNGATLIGRINGG